MSAGTFSISLSPSLPPREAISDTIYRSALAVDSADYKLLASAIFADATITVAGKTSTGLEEIKTAIFDPVSKLDTTHFISNIRVNIIDDKTAKATFSAQAFHYPPGEGVKPNAPRLVLGSLYAVDVAKDESSGLWKIRSSVVQPIWADGDWSVMAGLM